MKNVLLALIATGISIASFAQTDSTGTKIEKADTIKIGGMVIIRKGDKSDSADKGKHVVFSKRKSNAKVTTNWWVVDLGFANYNDNTNYAAAVSENFVQSGITEDNLTLRSGKSSNVNVWVFMQRLSLVKRVVNLKYGLGLELNNYRFDDKRVRIQEDPTKFVLDETLRDVEKNKLAADYVTVPLMLNFNFTPKREHGFGFSGGVSAGYLYSARQKFKFNDDKEKTHDDFNLRKWKLSYIGELALGPVKLYGTYALNSMWGKGLDQTPYSVGIRFSHF